ncbi:MAG: hypothetical protein HY876_01700 [Coriobacteriales bacterium]|nr:hypothetical protein [Coriobacteriales bacterium]
MPDVFIAAFWGLIASAPLIAGAWVALRWNPKATYVGLTAAFGAGALISAVSFELALDAVDDAQAWLLAIALAAGALTYYTGSRYLERLGGGSQGGAARGLALLMGAALDGVPESFILGITVASGEGLSIPFLVAVLASNLPEGMASAAELGQGSPYSHARVLQMWGVVIVVSGATAALGAAVGASGSATGALAESFAAGALLTMLVDDLVPEAREKAGISAGLAAVFGFAVAFGLHQLGA